MVGGGVGVGVGLGVGVGAGLGVGVGVGLGVGVGDGVGEGVAVGVACVVAVGLAPPIVGEEPGVAVVPVLTIAVGVVPVCALGELPPQAETSASRPNNNGHSQARNGDRCVLFCMFSFFPNIPRGIDERDFDDNSSTRKYCTRLHDRIIRDTHAAHNFAIMSSMPLWNGRQLTLIVPIMKGWTLQ
jgi:hypothetical protein